MKCLGVLWIGDVYPGSGFFHPGSRIRIRIKEFKFFFNPKIVTKLSEIWSGMFILDPGSWFFTHPRSLIQGSKRQHRILYPETQQCLLAWPLPPCTQGCPAAHALSWRRHHCCHVQCRRSVSYVRTQCCGTGTWTGIVGTVLFDVAEPEP